jgi:hypothetical protein
LEAKEKNLPGP